MTDADQEWEELKQLFNYVSFEGAVTTVQRPKPPNQEPPMTTPQYILTKNTLTLMADGQVYTVDNSHNKWQELLGYIKDKDWERVLDIIQIRDRITEFTTNADSITIKNDEVMFNGEVMHNSLCTRLIEMFYEGFDINPMLLFLSNMMENPSYTAIEGLYRFLENNKLPLTPDGKFLAYKRVNANLTDVHTGKIDNSVGQHVSMPRNRVEDNPDVSCSEGLHVCSLGYLRSFSGKRLIACKVNPRDVVSVPRDYGDSKMRVCAYDVVQELSMELVGGKDEAWDEPVVDPNDNLDETDDERVEDPRYEP